MQKNVLCVFSLLDASGERKGKRKRERERNLGRGEGNRKKGRSGIRKEERRRGKEGDNVFSWDHLKTVRMLLMEKNLRFGKISELKYL